MRIVDRKYVYLQHQIIEKKDWQLESAIYCYPVQLIRLFDGVGANEIYGVLF